MTRLAQIIPRYSQGLPVVTCFIRKTPAPFK